MSEAPTVEELVKNPFPEELKKIKKKQIIVTVSVTARDKEVASWLAEFFGTSRSDVMRTAVRHLYSDISSGAYKRPVE